MHEEQNLESLRANLYTKTRRSALNRNRMVQKQTNSKVQKGWKPPVTKQKKKRPYATWFLLGSTIFFVLAVIVAAAVLLQGGRTVSPNNIDIQIESSPAVASGETLRVLATIKNTNPVRLPFVELTATFPPGSRQAGNLSEAIQYEVKSLGPMKSGEEKEVSFEVALFGTEGEEKEINFRVEFRSENSNAIVVKEENYPVIISSAPLTVTVDAPQKVAPGEAFTTTVTVQTNSEDPVPNTVLFLEYPFGFSARDAQPVASLGNNVWDLGTLKPGEKKVITITGDVIGSSGEDRFITAQIGTNLSAAGDELGLVYMEQGVQISLVESQLVLSLSLDGNANEKLAARPGDDITARLTWKNNLDTQVFDAEIAVTVTGSGFDSDRMILQRGLYRPADSTIIFNRDTNPELQELDPGERGTIVFTIPVKRSNDLTGLRNPEISIRSSFSGREVGSGSPSTVITRTNRDVQIASEVAFVSSLVHTTGPFSNSGPIPPRVGESTSYTLSFVATNTTNTIANGVVRFMLPSYVSYTGSKNPSSATVVYDERTGEVRWNAGEIAPQGSKSLEIQLLFTPTQNHVGTTPELVGQQVFEGFDRFVQETVRAVAPSLNTAITADPAYTNGQGIVVP